jgi:DNA-binding transcriptional LysR family regulator
MLPFTLQQLRILKAVATEKNFTKAAEVYIFLNHH